MPLTYSKAIKYEVLVAPDGADNRECARIGKTLGISISFRCRERFVLDCFVLLPAYMYEIRRVHVPMYIGMSCRLPRARGEKQRGRKDKVTDEKKEGETFHCFDSLVFCTNRKVGKCAWLCS